MEWSKTTLVFALIFAILVPGINNDPLLEQIIGAAIGQPYMMPANIPGLQMGADVEISIRAEHLRDTDLFTKSDPICYTSTKSGINPLYTRIHNTEMILDDLSPTFMLKPILPSVGAEMVTIKFDFYDKDATRDDLLGTSTANLGQLIAQGTSQLTLQKRFMLMFQNSVRGKTVITAERLINSSDQVTFTLSAHQIARVDKLSLSDPYMEILKRSPGDNFVLVHRTEHFDNKRSANWAPFTIPMRQLCNGDFSRPLLFVCWDKNFNAASTLIGQFQTTLQELRLMNRNNFSLMSNSGQVRGTLIVGMQYNGTYQPGMATGGMPGMMPGAMTGMTPGAMTGMVPSAMTGVYGAQSLPTGQMGQTPMYGQPANASMVYVQNPNASLMYGQAQAPMNPYGMSAAVPGMQPGVPFVGANMSTVQPAGYPPTAGAYGSSMPVVNPYGVQQPTMMNQSMYPGGVMPPGNQGMYPTGSHYRIRRR